MTHIIWVYSFVRACWQHAWYVQYNTSIGERTLCLHNAGKNVASVYSSLPWAAVCRREVASGHTCTHYWGNQNVGLSPENIKEI